MTLLSEFGVQILDDGSRLGGLIAILRLQASGLRAPFARKAAPSAAE